MSQVQNITLKRKLSDLQEPNSCVKPVKVVVRSETGQSKCEASPATNGVTNACTRPQENKTAQQQNGDASNVSNEKTENAATPETVDKRKFLTARRASESRKRSFFRRFAQAELIGEGAFGKVYAGVRRKDGLPVAIKYIPYKRAKHLLIGPYYRITTAEVYFQQQADHPNIIKVLETHYFNHQHVIVTERPDKCIDLFDFLNSFQEVLSEDEARPIFREVLQAAVHLDEHGIVHNDIKSENIILDISDGGKAKLIDFGLASKISDNPIRKFSGTPQFCPPEFHTQGQYYGRKATVWSLGCFLYDLLMGKTPYDNAEQAATLPFCLTESLSEDLFEIMGMMLQKNPAQRVSLHQLMEHSWVRPAYEPHQSTLRTYSLLERLGKKD